MRLTLQDRRAPVVLALTLVTSARAVFGQPSLAAEDDIEELVVDYAGKHESYTVCATP